MLDRLKQIFAIVALLFVSVLCSELIYTVHVIRPKIKEAASNLNDTTSDVKDYVHEQIVIVRSPAYQKNFEHASELGDIASKTVAQISRQTIPRVNKTIDELAAAAVSLRGVSDETRIQVKQNGDEAMKTIASLNKTVTDTDTRFTKILEDGSLILETANPKLQGILDHANAAIIDADGRIKAFEPIQANLAGITSDFNAITTDSKDKLHSIFYPERKFGWARVGQLVMYALTPVLEGSRLYFTLTSLPVRITQPLPIGKP